MTDSDKHPSFLRYRINYDRKEFYSAGLRLYIIKTLYKRLMIEIRKGLQHCLKLAEMEQRIFV